LGSTFSYDFIGERCWFIFMRDHTLTYTEVQTGASVDFRPKQPGACTYAVDGGAPSFHPVGLSSTQNAFFVLRSSLFSSDRAPGSRPTYDSCPVIHGSSGTVSGPPAMSNLDTVADFGHSTTNSSTTPSYNTAAATQTTQDTNIPATHPPHCPAQPVLCLRLRQRQTRRGHLPAHPHADASMTSCFAGFAAETTQPFFGRFSFMLRTVWRRRFMAPSVEFRSQKTAPLGVELLACGGAFVFAFARASRVG
jgi:hypothetical protein